MFFSVIGGLQVFGILGIVIGPVVVAITLALLDVFRKADRPVVTMGQAGLNAAAAAAAPPGRATCRRPARRRRRRALPRS